MTAPPPPPPPQALWQPPPLAANPAAAFSNAGATGTRVWPPASQVWQGAGPSPPWPAPVSFLSSSDAQEYAAPPALSAGISFGGVGANRIFPPPAAAAGPVSVSSTLPGSVWAADADVDAPALCAEEDTADVSPHAISEVDMSDAEEEEARERPVHLSNAHSTHGRLHLHPIVSDLGLAYGAGSTPVDPVTAALARQRQQLHRGEPRSPLSPHTLAALCGASAEGRHRDFLSQLTAEDVLAPPPLALTWYPDVPPDVTLHPERKRTAGDVVAHTMARHEVDRLAEEETRGGGGDGVHCASDMQLQPRQRLRTDPLSSFQPGTASAAAGAAAAASATLQDGPSPDAAPQDDWLTTEASAAAGDKGEGRADVAATGTAAGEDGLEGDRPLPRRSDAHRKRERSERVYEFPSHGRRLN